MMPTNLATLLLDPDARLPDELLYFEDQVVARSDLVATARDVAGRLREAGVRPGMPVGGLLPNHPDTIAAIFAVWAADAVYVPLNPRAPRAEIEAFASGVGLAAVIGEAAILRSQCDMVGGTLHMTLGDWSVDGVVAPHAQPYPSDLALILSTSGTTGTPKPVALRHTAWRDGIETVLRKLKPERPEAERRRGRGVNIIPFSLSLGAGIWNTCFSFRAGRGVALMKEFSPDDFARLVNRFSVGAAVLAPAMIAMLLDDPSLTSLSPLRSVRTITAPLPAHHARALYERFGVFPLNGYGQTELGEVIGWNADDIRQFGTRKLGSIGRPHPGVSIRFAEDGELLVRSPYMMDGYLDGSMNDRLDDDGFLATGDIGFVDEDGFVWLSGRKSDMINRGGLKVFPDEVEDVILRHPAVREVAVVGMPDDRLGEVPWAFVVTAGGEVGSRLADDLCELCARSLVPYKVPARFVALEALPRNDAGKVLRRNLATDEALRAEVLRGR
jgi:acyl-CoA synthetase (AMP-forming)/AMP-acid ligase II